MRYLFTMAALAALFSFTAPHDVFGQTWPEPFNLSEGDYVFQSWPENSPAGTYPGNMRFHRGPGQDPSLTAEPNADYDGPYNATAGPRINGMGTDGFSFLNTGTGGDLGAAVVAVNTTDLANVQVAWTGGTVAAADRPYRIRLQYRVGSSGPFTDVPGPVEYVPGATGHSQNFVTTLPPETADEPVVQIRWKYYQAGSGAGARPRLRVDEITITTSESPASGTGVAHIDPDLIQGGSPQIIEITVAAQSDEPEDQLTHIEFTLPDWAVGVTSEDISLHPEGGLVTVEERVVLIADAEISESEPLTIRISDLVVPDLSGVFEFAIRTGAGTAQTVGLAQQPALKIWGTPIPISEAGQNNAQGVSTRIGEWVTIQGVVTVSDQFQTGGGELGPSYLEDESGGFAVFSPSGVTERVNLGDEVILLGRVDQFFGLNQLDNTTIVVEKVSTGNLLTPEVVTLSQLASDGAGGVEVYEGRLVRVNNVTVNTSVWNVEGAGTNYVLTDATGQLDVRINRAADFRGASAPSAPFDIVGVVSQFRPGEPFIGGYQLMPRFAQDIIVEGEAPAFTSRPPFEESATPTSVTVSWRTDRPAHSEVRYGVTGTYELGSISDEEPKTEHTLVLTDLEPATIYTVQLRSAVGTDTSATGAYYVSTTAASGTTHAINVYFNKPVDHELALHQEAVVRSPIFALLDRINAAQHSIDVALYSLSGTVGANLANALIAARDRGVQVRVIMDSSTDQTAPPRNLRDSGIPFINDGFGQNDGNAGLHHNKFAVIDHYGGAPEDIWIFMGSWNPTDPGTHEHFQNVIEIQDGALAAAYTREFEQMWGGSSATANAAESRFGARKQWRSPAAFWIGDVYLQLFFSPQGYGVHGTTEHQMIQTLNTADHAIDLGLNLITRSSIVDAMRARYDQGVKVRGVIGETGTTGSVFGPLSSWADVHAFPSGQLGLLHHKYAIVDAEYEHLNPAVITGAHNWSRAANESNDENTLIIWDANIANQYLQEFALRYRQAGGEDQFSVSVEQVAVDVPETFTLSNNYPNPFNPATTFEYKLPYHSHVTVSIYNALGQRVATLVDAGQGPGTYSVRFDASELSSGIYLYRVEATGEGGSFTETRRMVLVK